MKGYQINTELYIFPQEAGVLEIGEDVTKIYIQYEQLNAFKALNNDIANLMVGYNYNVMTVLPKVWEDHMNDDLEPEPEPELYTINNYSQYAKLSNSDDGVYEEAPEGELIPIGPSTNYDQDFNGTELNNVFWILYDTDARDVFTDAEFNSETKEFNFNMPASSLIINDVRDYNVILADDNEYYDKLEVSPRKSTEFQLIEIIWNVVDEVPTGLNMRVTDLDGNNPVTVEKHTEDGTSWTFDMPEHSVLVTPYIEEL